MKELIFGNAVSEPICLALGFFDSVHIGHRTIIENMKKQALASRCKSAVFTFSNNIYKVFDANEKQVYTYEERKRVFDSLGIDFVVKAEFDETFKKISAKDFLCKLLDNSYVKHLFCGYDYKFGNNGVGNVEFLKNICLSRGIDVSVTQQVDYSGKRVSTTLIKSLLQQGNIVDANTLLVDKYFIEGEVVHGRNVGHIFGIPTANIIFSEDKLLPSCGVFATYASVRGKRFKAVTNIGGKPTFGDNRLSVETMIEGLNEDIYGERLVLEFVEKIRNIKKFAEPKELSEQIHKDMNWRS